MPIVDEFPFPFEKPEAQELMRVMAALYAKRNEALTLTGIDPAIIPDGLAARDMWYGLLAELAKIGRVRNVVQAAVKQFPTNRQVVPFLLRLLSRTNSSIHPSSYIYFLDRDEQEEALEKTNLTNNLVVISIVAREDDLPNELLKRISCIFQEFFEDNRGCYQDIPQPLLVPSKTESLFRRIIKLSSGGYFRGEYVHDALVGSLCKASSCRAFRFEIFVNDNVSEKTSSIRQFIHDWPSACFNGRLSSPIFVIILIESTYKDDDIPEEVTKIIDDLKEISSNCNIEFVDLEPLRDCKRDHISSWIGYLRNKIILSNDKFEESFREAIKAVTESREKPTFSMREARNAAEEVEGRLKL